MKNYRGTDDAALAAAAQQGDRLAESELVKRYSPLTEGIARSYFLVGADSDDLVQIGMIALMEAVRSYSPDRGAEFRTYASVCVRNGILDAVRSAAAGKNAALNDSLRIEDGDAENGGRNLAEIVSPELSPEQQYIAKEAEETFFDALTETLGERDLNVIKLYLACVPYKEISKKLGISAKKVDNTIYGAKKKIARILKDLDKAD